MPGMDGFQAVQAIKNNPRTAMIPILMYTSQEGELYLGQARALGAVGVLPKSVAPADVRRCCSSCTWWTQPEAGHRGRAARIAGCRRGRGQHVEIEALPPVPPRSMWTACARKSPR